MTIETPKWYSNLKLWREENGCTGELWEIYAKVTGEKVKRASYAFGFFGFGIGMLAMYIILKWS